MGKSTPAIAKWQSSSKFKAISKASVAGECSPIGKAIGIWDNYGKSSENHRNLHRFSDQNMEHGPMDGFVTQPHFTEFSAGQKFELLEEHDGTC